MPAEDVPHDVLFEHVFSELHPRDLMAYAMTSKASSSLVEEYVEKNARLGKFINLNGQVEQFDVRAWETNTWQSVLQRMSEGNLTLEHRSGKDWLLLAFKAAWRGLDLQNMSPEDENHAAHISSQIADCLDWAVGKKYEIHVRKAVDEWLTSSRRTGSWQNALRSHTTRFDHDVINLENDGLWKNLVRGEIYWKPNPPSAPQ